MNVIFQGARCHLERQLLGRGDPYDVAEKMGLP